MYIFCIFGIYFVRFIASIRRSISIYPMLFLFNGFLLLVFLTDSADVNNNKLQLNANKPTNEREHQQIMIGISNFCFLVLSSLHFLLNQIKFSIIIKIPWELNQEMCFVLNDKKKRKRESIGCGKINNRIISIFQLAKDNAMEKIWSEKKEHWRFRLHWRNDKDSAPFF